MSRLLVITQPNLRDIRQGIIYFHLGERTGFGPRANKTGVISKIDVAVPTNFDFKSIANPETTRQSTRKKNNNVDDNDDDAVHFSRQ
jgi:hypothetical protein